MTTILKVRVPVKKEIEIPIRHLTIADLEAMLKPYEEKYGMSSAEFYEKFERREIEEDWDTLNWYMDYRMYLRAIGQLDENA